MTGYEAACEFIRASDIVRELLSAGIHVSPALSEGLADARRALDVLLTPPKPVYPREPVIVAQHGERYGYAPSAGRRLAPEPARSAAQNQWGN